MRILIINRALGTYFGGGEAFDERAAHFLAKAGHEVKVLTAGSAGAVPAMRFDVDVECVQSPNLRRWAYRTERVNTRLSAFFYHADSGCFRRAALAWLRQSHRHGDFEVIHTCGMFGLAEAILNGWRIPTVSWLPGIPSRREQRVIGRLMQHPGFRLFSHGDPLVFVKERLGVDDVRCIEPGVDAEVVAAAQARPAVALNEHGIPDDAIVGATVARLVPVKNIAFLIEALARAAEAVPSLIHVFAGDGPERRELNRKAQSLGVGDRVRFIGHQTPASVHSLLAQSDFFVLPSTYESFSIASLEAMSHGLPVIATKVGYLQHLIDQSGAGLTVPLGDVDALQKAIVRVAADSELRETFSERGRRFARQFAWPRVARSLAALYDEAIGAAHVG